MTKPLLSDRTVRGLRHIAERGLTNLSVGGDAWSVTRIAGSGIGTSTRTPTVIGTIAVLVFQDTDATERTAAAGTTAAVAPWKAAQFAASAITLQAGDVLTSIASPSHIFTVIGPDREAIYPTFLLKRGT